MNIENQDGIKYMQSGAIDKRSVDLILTDPPYIISRETGMNTHYNKINGDSEKLKKTEAEWLAFTNEKEQSSTFTPEQKKNFLAFGTIYGKKYGVKTDYGEWDKTFTMEILDTYIKEYYERLRPGGTLIIFFDIWKITPLKELLEKHKFKQIRFVEWLKTNPQPINSKVNYLTNCREIALLAVKGGKPTFNSSYDKGVYSYPLQGGKIRTHPTQKSLMLFEDLIRKHSNEGDTVVDTFLGGGTTALACKNTGRVFKGCEISLEYFNNAVELVKD